MKMNRILLASIALLFAVGCTQTTSTTDVPSDSLAVVKVDTVVADTTVRGDSTPLPPQDPADKPSTGSKPAPTTGGKNTTPDPVPASKPIGGRQSDPSLARLNVSLYSIGSGINSKAKKALQDFLEGYNKKGQTNVTYEVIHWGREGETDFCFKLSEMDATQQIEFIEKVKKALDGMEHVQMSEYFKCRQPRQITVPDPDKKTRSNKM